MAGTARAELDRRAVGLARDEHGRAGLHVADEHVRDRAVVHDEVAGGADEGDPVPVGGDRGRAGELRPAQGEPAAADARGAVRTGARRPAGAADQGRRAQQVVAPVDVHEAVVVHIAEVVLVGEEDRVAAVGAHRVDPLGGAGLRAQVAPVDAAAERLRAVGAGDQERRVRRQQQRAGAACVDLGEVVVVIAAHRVARGAEGDQEVAGSRRAARHRRRLGEPVGQHAVLRPAQQDRRAVAEDRGAEEDVGEAVGVPGLEVGGDRGERDGVAVVGDRGLDRRRVAAGAGGAVGAADEHQGVVGHVAHVDVATAVVVAGREIGGLGGEGDLQPVAAQRRVLRVAVALPARGPARHQRGRAGEGADEDVGEVAGVGEDEVARVGLEGDAGGVRGERGPRRSSGSHPRRWSSFARLSICVSEVPRSRT